MLHQPPTAGGSDDSDDGDDGRAGRCGCGGQLVIAGIDGPWVAVRVVQRALAPEMTDLPAESTINEPVSVTLMRDANRVARRMKLVLKPHGFGSGPHDEMKAELRNWDLWGPLVICMLLAVLLSLWSPADQAATVFCAVFGIIWVGAAVVTLNAQLLEGRISFFQSVCVLGYCVFPLCVSALLCQICQLVLAEGILWLDMLLRCIFVFAGGLWATNASSVFLTDVVPEKRRTLAAFPLSLFYFSISMMVFIQTLTPSTPLPSIVTDIP